MYSGRARKYKACRSQDLGRVVLDAGRAQGASWGTVRLTGGPGGQASHSRTSFPLFPACKSTLEKTRQLLLLAKLNLPRTRVH